MHISQHFLTLKKKGYAFFWNVDADDTAFCCNVEKRCELLRMAEEYARRNDLDAFSYDMWWTRSVGTHWSFGITFTKTMQIMIGKKITKSTMCSITLIGSLLLRKRRASLNAVHFTQRN